MSLPLKPHCVVDALKSWACRLSCNSVPAVPGSPTQHVHFYFTPEDNLPPHRILIYLFTVVRTSFWVLKGITGILISLNKTFLLYKPFQLCLENPKWLFLLLSQCHHWAGHCNAQLLASFTVCRKWLTVKDEGGGQDKHSSRGLYPPGRTVPLPLSRGCLLPQHTHCHHMKHWLTVLLRVWQI